MLLDITRALRAPGEEIPFLHRDAIPPQEIFGDTVEFSQVLLTGHFSVTDERLRLHGELTAVAHGHCARCLMPVDYQVKVPFDETFVRLSRFTQEKDPLDDQEEWTYEGSKVDLSHLSMTLAVLDLPIRFECGDSCPGYAGLPEENTQTTHACQKDLPDQHPFSALQQLLTKDQEV